MEKTDLEDAQDQVWAGVWAQVWTQLRAQVLDQVFTQFRRLHEKE